MIPRVQVPMDFGIQYLGSPAHSNLKFLLGSGEEILANSMIVSYNSPVVDRMTTQLFQSTIEVEEFSKDAVQCFLEASYSGNIKKISKLNFRDVNKMAYAFEVTWLIERCFSYFQSLTDEVTANEFDSQRYIFDEAMFILEKLKQKNFIEAVIKRFISLESYIQYFATHYLVNLSSCPLKSLDMIMKMTGKQEHILVEVLCKNFELNKSSIDSNSRYILENLNFAACQEIHKGLYEKLFKQLEEIQNPTKDDYRLTMKIILTFYRSSTICELNSDTSSHQITLPSPQVVTPTQYKTSSNPNSFSRESSPSHTESEIRQSIKSNAGDELLRRLHNPPQTKPKSHQSHQSYRADDKWLYFDYKGILRGPYNSVTMYSWYKEGHFPMDMMIGLSADTMFTTLESLIRKCGRIPFQPEAEPPPSSYHFQRNDLRNTTENPSTSSLDKQRGPSSDELW